MASFLVFGVVSRASSGEESKAWEEVVLPADPRPRRVPDNGGYPSVRTIHCDAPKTHRLS